jgi:26S proteasome regulatory subunit N1
MAMAMLNISNPKPEVLESLSRLAHDRDEVTAFQAILGIGLVAAGTNNSRGAQSLRQQAEFFAKDSESLFLVRLAQGLLHCGRGLMTLAPQRSDHLILSKPGACLFLVALSGLLTTLNLFYRSTGRSPYHRPRIH